MSSTVSSERIRIGCIGTGIIAGTHLSYLRSREDVEIAALCDPDADNLEKRRSEFGGETYAEFGEMLDKQTLDAVWVCTPPQVRRDPLVACAGRGIPVMCEKPVQRSVAQAEAIASELRELKANVQVGYVLRSVPIVRRLQEAMADDAVHLVQSFYGCPAGRTHELPDWFYDKALSGGALIDQATHNFDLLRMLIGEVQEVRGLVANPVCAKRAGYTIDEVVTLSFLFENGAGGSHVHTWVGDQWRNEILFVGEKRVYRLDLWRGVLTVEQGDEPEIFRQDQNRLYEPENERFLAMVASGDWRDNPCTFDEGAASLKLILACDAAASGD